MAIKKQRGFLALISVGIIIIVGIVTAVLVGILTGDIKAGENTFQTNAAFHLGISALQIVKRDIMVNGTTCLGVNGQAVYTNANLNGILGTNAGVYNVDCVQNIVTTTLANTLNSTDTDELVLNSYTPVASTTLSSSVTANETSSIALTSTTGFTYPGIVKIDDEYIQYATISGTSLQTLIRGLAASTPSSHNSGQTVYLNRNLFFPKGYVSINAEIVGYSGISGDGLTLYNLTRGVASTYPETHNSGSIVRQIQMVFTALTGVPSITNVTGTKTLQETLFSQSFFTLLPPLDFYQPALIVTGPNTLGSSPFYNVMIDGNTRIYADSAIVGPTDIDFPGSTLMTTGNAIFIGSSAKTGYGTGGSSTPTANNGDILLNSTVTSASTLYSSIFAQTPAALMSEATKTMTAAQFTANWNTITTDDVVYVTESLTIDFTMSISPQLLIIDGNLTIGGKNKTMTIGTSTNPTMMLITGNHLIPSVQGSTSYIVTGITYIDGNFYSPASINLSNFIGLTAVHGTVQVDKLGTFTRDNSVIQIIQNRKSELFNIPCGLREIFH